MDSLWFRDFGGLALIFLVLHMKNKNKGMVKRMIDPLLKRVSLAVEVRRNQGQQF